MDPLTIGLLIWGGSKLLKAKKTADRLEYFPKNLFYSKTEKKFYFIMDILNPTKNPLKIDSFFGGVFIGTDKVGSIEYGTPVTIQALKRTEVKYPIIPIGSGFGKVIVKILKGEGKDLKFKVMGVARSMGIDNPVNQELTL